VKFSIIHPTARLKASFQHPWWEAAARAADMCDHPEDIEYILVVHQSRALQFSGRWFPFGKFTLVINYGRDCLVDQGNTGRLAATGGILIGGMDDLFFPPHWDTRIAAAVPDSSQRIAVHCLTGSPRDHELFVPSVFTKALSDAMGPTDPAYESMFTDDEATILFRKLGKIVDTDIRFEHKHPAFGTAEMDEVYSIENRMEAYRRGKAVFDRRRAAGFPRVDLPGWPKDRYRVSPAQIEDAEEALRATLPSETRQAGEYDAPPAPPRKERILAFCTPGEQHRFDWEREHDALVFSLVNEGWTVRDYYGYTTNVFHTRMGMTRSMFIDAETTGQEPEFVLWIDDDNMPSIPAVRELMSTLEQHPEYSGAVGWCWIKWQDEHGNHQWMPSAGNFQPGTLHLLSTKLSDLYADNGAPKQIEWSGFPTALIRYEAARQLGTKAFLPIFTDENEYGMTGEDIPWFVAGQKAGMKFCVCPRAKVEHLKFQEIEPDYEIGPNADPIRAKLVEQDRARHNGARVETTPQVKELMEASM
jgi:hypothetical protein